MGKASWGKTIKSSISELQVRNSPPKRADSDASHQIFEAHSLNKYFIEGDLPPISVGHPVHNIVHKSQMPQHDWLCATCLRMSRRMALV